MSRRIEKLSDQEIEDFMNEIASENEFEDLDDSIKDPDYQCDELKPEDDAMINDCLLLDSSSLVNAVTLSMNVSNLSLNTISALEITVNERVSSVANAEIESNEAAQRQEQLEDASSFKSKKKRPITTANCGSVWTPSNAFNWWIHWTR